MRSSQTNLFILIFFYSSFNQNIQEEKTQNKNNRNQSDKKDQVKTSVDNQNSQTKKKITKNHTSISFFKNHDSNHRFFFL